MRTVSIINLRRNLLHRKYNYGIIWRNCSLRVFLNSNVKTVLLTFSIATKIHGLKWSLPVETGFSQRVIFSSLLTLIRVEKTCDFDPCKKVSTSAKYRNLEGLSVCLNEVKAAQSATMTVDSTQGCPATWVLFLSPIPSSPPHQHTCGLWLVH